MGAQAASRRDRKQVLIAGVKHESRAYFRPRKKWHRLVVTGQYYRAYKSGAVVIGATDPTKVVEYEGEKLAALTMLECERGRLGREGVVGLVIGWLPSGKVALLEGAALR